MRTAAVVAALIVPTAAWAAQQPPTPQTPGTAPVAQAAVTGCAQAHPMAERTIDMTNRRLETARQANSPAAMRAAIDEMQAALRQLRTEIAPCAGVQSGAAADPHAGHLMPGSAQAPSAAPGAPVTRPGSTAPTPAATAPAAPAPGAADPHAGHVMPGAPAGLAAAPQTPASRAPAAAARTPATRQRRAAPAAADAHAGHVMPAAPASRTRPAPATRPSAAGAPPAKDAHDAGHAMPPASSQQGTPAGAGRAAAAAPPTNVADLKCTNAVNPKTAPRMLYRGRMYYFCTEASRAEFAKDPAKYVAAPPVAAPAHAH